ncbi:MAG: uncharacterized protein KVP18_004277 [Porospora cf. gigantea A]|nr:MAG: hypothetical protein KVP18_004277 [Porospora cf. gigantea A]
MTEYQHAEAELAGLVPRMEALVNGEVTMSTYGAVREAIVGLEPRIIRMKMKALEKDPDKKIYGPKMTTRVLEMSDRFETMHEVWMEELEPVFGSAYSAHLERLRQEEAVARALLKTEAAALVARGREQTRFEEEQRQLALVEHQKRLQACDYDRDLLLDRVKDASEARQAERFKAIARVRTTQAGLQALSPTQQVSKALRELATKPTFGQVNRGLFNLLSAVVNEPGEQRHRTLRLSNSLFSANIAHTDGYEGVLL